MLKSDKCKSQNSAAGPPKKVELPLSLMHQCNQFRESSGGSWRCFQDRKGVSHFGDVECWHVSMGSLRSDGTENDPTQGHTQQAAAVIVSESRKTMYNAGKHVHVLCRKTFAANHKKHDILPHVLKSVGREEPSGSQISLIISTM